MINLEEKGAIICILVLPVVIGALAYFSVINPTDHADDAPAVEPYKHCLEWDYWITRENLPLNCRESTNCRYNIQPSYEDGKVILQEELTVIEGRESPIVGNLNCTRWVNAEQYTLPEGRMTGSRS